MSDRAMVIAALILGGAIVAASFQLRSRFALSAADSSIAWRMDTWSGQIDICAAGYTPKGPIVRCGAYVVQPPAGSAAPRGGGEARPSEQAVPPSSGADAAGLEGGKDL